MRDTKDGEKQKSSQQTQGGRSSSNRKATKAADPEATTRRDGPSGGHDAQAPASDSQIAEVPEEQKKQGRWTQAEKQLFIDGKYLISLCHFQWDFEFQISMLLHIWQTKMGDINFLTFMKE